MLYLNDDLPLRKTLKTYDIVSQMLLDEYMYKLPQ